MSYERKRIKLICKQCRKEIFVPPSVAKKKHFCSKKCSDDFKRDYVKRKCKNCKEYFFLPRWELNKGKGTFCSRKCFQNYNGETSIESLIRRSLKRRKIDFIQEFKIGCYYSDFFIPSSKLIVECDGEYWHSTEYAKKRDLKKNEFLKTKGYEVIRFTEKEIKKTKGNCIDSILTTNLTVSNL